MSDSLGFPSCIILPPYFICILIHVRMSSSLSACQTDVGDYHLSSIYCVRINGGVLKNGVLLSFPLFFQSHNLTYFRVIFNETLSGSRDKKYLAQVTLDFGPKMSKHWDMKAPKPTYEVRPTSQTGQYTKQYNFYYC